MRYLKTHFQGIPVCAFFAYLELYSKFFDENSSNLRKTGLCNRFISGKEEITFQAPLTERR